MRLLTSTLVEVEVRPAAPLMPSVLRELDVEARASGIQNVSVLIDRWVGGSERFDGTGESLLVAVDPALNCVVGVGGLSRCPDVEGALRVRRFYVGEQWRRRGIARTLARQLVTDGLRHTNVLTCNAGASDAAAPFWEAMGFEPVDAPGITHWLTDEAT